MPYYFDSYYLVLVLPAILISLIAQLWVKSAYGRYSKKFSAYGLSAAAAVRKILDASGLDGVEIEHISGELTDHFDPRANVIRLSDSVYDSSSVAAIGVAAHEAGHAMQHASGYVPIKIRNAVYPAASFGSRLAMPMIVLGLILSFGVLVDLGIILFSAAVLFQLVTLPVEFNASRRAMATLSDGILSGEELSGAKRVLTVAAMTYVAAALVSAMQLLRLVLLSRNRRN